MTSLANHDDQILDDLENIIEHVRVSAPFKEEVDAAVRDALEQIRQGSASAGVLNATLFRLHAAALKVAGAARDPLEAEGAADRSSDYLTRLYQYVDEALDRLATRRSRH